MFSNLFGGRRVSRKKHRRKRRHRRSKKRRLYRNFFRYETFFYDKKKGRVKIYIGNGRFVEHKKMLNHLLSEVKFFIRQDSRNMKLDPNYSLTVSEIDKWKKWAKAHAEKYVRKYSGRVWRGRYWEVGMGPGEITRQLFEDWEERRIRYN